MIMGEPLLMVPLWCISMFSPQFFLVACGPFFETSIIHFNFLKLKVFFPDS